MWHRICDFPREQFWTVAFFPMSLLAYLPRAQIPRLFIYPFIFSTSPINAVEETEVSFTFGGCPSSTLTPNFPFELQLLKWLFFSSRLDIQENDVICWRTRFSLLELQKTFCIKVEVCYSSLLSSVHVLACQGSQMICFSLCFFWACIFERD